MQTTFEPNEEMRKQHERYELNCAIHKLDAEAGASRFTLRVLFYPEIDSMHQNPNNPNLERLDN